MTDTARAWKPDFWNIIPLTPSVRKVFKPLNLASEAVWGTDGTWMPDTTTVYTIILSGTTLVFGDLLTTRRDSRTICRYIGILRILSTGSPPRALRSGSIIL